jgi:hypothetical protein
MKYKFSLRLLFKFGLWQDVLERSGDHTYYDETFWTATLLPGLYWSYPDV